MDGGVCWRRNLRDSCTQRGYFRALRVQAWQPQVDVRCAKAVKAPIKSPICDVLRTPVDVVKDKFKVAINNTIHRTLVPDSRPVVAATPASV